MAKRPIPTVAADFAEVLAFLTEKGVICPNPANELIGNARRIHGLTYSLIIWRFRLRGLPERSKVFIEEIASDALQILPQIVMGYAKTTKLLMRGMIENVLRHIYFADHPIEFWRMNSDQKWFVEFRDLCAYARIHPSFATLEPKFDAINQLASLHSELSGGLHGRTVRDLEMRVALKKIKYDPKIATDDTEHLRKCTAAANFLLSVFHAQRVRELSADDRRIILRSMPADARRVWSHYA